MAEARRCMPSRGRVEVNYGSAENGSFPHLTMEKLAQDTGIKLTHVPFRGFEARADRAAAAAMSMCWPPTSRARLNMCAPASCVRWR